MRSGISARAVGAAQVILLLAVASGCAATNAPFALAGGSARVRSSVLSTKVVSMPPRPEGCYLDLVLDRSPERPFLVLGQVTTVWTGLDRRGLRATNEEALLQLRNQACQSGAHALFQIRTDVQDQWFARATTARAVTADAFARTVTATAVMAVYVRRDGSPMEPPEGARRVIRVPTPLELQVSVPSDASDEAAMAWGQGITDPWAVPAD